MTNKSAHGNRPQRSARYLFVAASALLACLTLPSQAQTLTVPVAVSGATFARTATRFYIQGGQAGTTNYGQFYFLDLAANWSTSAPAWNQLNDGPQQNIFPSVFSADQKTFITFHGPSTTFAYRYSVASATSGQWSPSSLTVINPNYQGVNAVTDPTTGLVYLAGGYTDPTRNSIDVYSFTTDAIVSSPLPNPTVVFAARSYYTNVWSLKRNSILYFGGYNSTLQPIANGNVVTEFVPSTQQWSTLTTTGTGPSMRADHCMASNDDGSLMIIYGGRPANGTYSGEVFIFNTVSQVWSSGNAGPARIYATCTIAGNQLLVWGGIDGSNNVATTGLLIYNITSGLWVTQYVPPQAYVAERATETTAATSSPTATTPVNPTPSNHAGAIAGGVVVGVAVICAGVLFFLFNRRRHRATPVKTSDREDAAELKQPEQNEELQRIRAQLQTQQEQLEYQQMLFQQQQQQQQLQQPVQQYQYQDATYNYQPPIFYSPTGALNAAVAPSLESGLNSSPDSNNAVPASLAHSGYIDGNSRYVVAPVVHASTLVTSQAPVGQIGTKLENTYWEERPRGNPHTIIDS